MCLAARLEGVPSLAAKNDAGRRGQCRPDGQRVVFVWSLVELESSCVSPIQGNGNFEPATLMEAPRVQRIKLSTMRRIIGKLRRMLLVGLR